MAVKNNQMTQETAWNLVAVEERIDLVSRVQTDGLIIGFFSFIAIASIAYGLDQIKLFYSAIVFAVFITPVSINYKWKRERPALILAYLAVRALARRYSFAFRIDSDLHLIYRGQMQELDNPKSDPEVTKDVWVCLFNGGLIVLQERIGGAKLAYVTTITNATVCRKTTPEESSSSTALMIIGSDMSKDKRVIIDSISLGAQYVLEKKFNQFISEYVSPANFLNGIVAKR